MQQYYKNKTKLITTLAKIIKQKRTKANKSISIISDEIGMSKSIWADMEKGIKDPQLSTLWRICQGLEISPTEIIHELEVNLQSNFSLID